MTMHGLQIVSEGIGHALSDNDLAVPVYQRSYAWEEAHVADLFHDIADAISQDESEYFLGSIVVTSEGSGKRPEVVDGQQRLATAAILLAAIRDHFYWNKDRKRSDGIETEYLIKTDLRSQEVVPHLRLNETDNEYFRSRVLLNPDDPLRKACVKEKPTKDSHKRINDAAKLAAKHVESVVKPYKDESRGGVLIDWVDFIRDKARVIWVTVPDQANAFVIFETLNDRGLELSTSDLLKNYLFGRSGDRLSEVRERWALMIGALETVSGEEITKLYIKHLWASLHGPVREKQLYASIKSTVKSKQSAIDLSTNLADNATAYAAILNPTHEHWNPYGSTTRRHIGTLRTLRAEQLRPLLLAVAKQFSVPEAKKAIRLFVCWAVRFLLAGGHGGGVMEKAYAERAIEVRKEKISKASELVVAMKDFVPSDPVFENAFSTAIVSKADLARYYLRAIYMTRAGDKEPELVVNSEEDDVNLEHILPQVPGKNWPQFTPELAEAYYRRLGNMVLMKATPNSQIGSEPFGKKCVEYKKSSFPLTSEVANSADWREIEIDARQKELAALAVKTWPITV